MIVVRAKRDFGGLAVWLSAAALAVMIGGTAWAAPVGNVPHSFGPATKQFLAAQTGEPPGSIIISTAGRTLDLVVSSGEIARYSIGVARNGFAWSGTVRIGRKVEWPQWRPPAEMLQRDPSLPVMMPGGPFNPLGARALYLFDGDRDTLYRIHGTNEVGSIGGFVSSGCFRMTNADVLDLYRRVSVGAKVIVK